MTTHFVRRVLVALLASVILTGLSRAEDNASRVPVGNAEAPPRDIVLVLDNSGSMKYNDRDFVTRKAAAQFIQEAANSAHVSVIIFDEVLRESVKLGPTTGPGRDALLTALDNMNYQGHLTNIPEALNRALNEVKEHGREEARKIVVLLTDGVVETGNKQQNRTSRQTLLQDLIPAATTQGIHFFTIALGKKSDAEFLQALARRSEGEYFWAASGKDLPVIFEQINTATSQTELSTLVPSKAEAKVTLTDDLGTLDAPTAKQADDLHGNATVTKSDSSGATDTNAAITADSHSADTSASAATSQKSTRRHRHFSRLHKADIGKPTKPVTTATSDGHSWWFDLIGVAIVGAMIWLLYMMAKTRKSTLMATDPIGAHTGFRNFQTPAPQAVLHDLTGVTGCQRHEIDSVTTLIGRVPPAPHEQVGCIVIDRQTIGRRHAVIERKHYGFWLIDQHSKNGTYINDQRVTGEVCLSHGDRIRFHEYDFEFNLAGMGLADDTVPLSDFVAQNLRKVGGMQR